MTWLFGASSFKVAGREVIQEHLLADGGFAYVYRGRDAQTGEALAIRKALLQDSQAQQAARLEMTLLERLPYHDSIVRFLGAEILEGEARKLQAVSLFELCTGGTLFARVEAVKQQAITDAEGSQLRYCCPCLPEAEVLAVLRNASSALNHLHAHGVIHYDVKSENLMLGADGLWKLGDFGSASERTFEFEPAAPRKLLLEVEEFVHGRCTPIFRAPEVADVHLRWPIGHKVDVFALGCVIFACLTGIHPFPMDSALANIQARYQVPVEAELAYTSKLLRWLKDLLQRHPSDRPDAGTLSKQVQAFLGEAPVQEPEEHHPTPAEPDWVADFSQLPRFEATPEVAAVQASTSSSRLQLAPVTPARLTVEGEMVPTSKESRAAVPEMVCPETQTEAPETTVPSAESVQLEIIADVPTEVKCPPPNALDPRKKFNDPAKQRKHWPIPCLCSSTRTRE